MVRWILVGAGALLLGIVTFLAMRWPYAERRILARLERATGSKVRYTRFRSSYFPKPGCTIEGIALVREPRVTIAQAAALRIESTWWNLFTLQKRISLIEAQGARVQVPSPFPPPAGSAGAAGTGDVVIGEFVTQGATVEFVSPDQQAPARFAVSELRLREVGRDKEVSYRVVLDIPNPPGRVTSSGTAGPFLSGSKAWGSTPVAGTFALEGASLDQYRGLSGIIDGKGTFRGPLESVEVHGTAVASRFEVNHTGHRVDLHTSYRAVVNGTSGDVLLESAHAEFLRSRLTVDGHIQGTKGKVVSLRFGASDARTEDLLTLFTRSNPPALAGPIQLQAAAELPPGKERFLRRLVLRGNFDLPSARWLRPSTQEKVNGLSARARGDKRQVEDRAAEDVDHVLSHLKGDVSLKGGVASLSDVWFRVPGATATGGGTFDLITKKVDLRGTVSMVADASEASSGFKSVLLKPFDRLFRRRGEKGATLPATITGQYPRPEYRVGLRR